MIDLGGKRVAFIQNRVQPGGRFQVMAEMISVLNNLNVTPDILCFKNRVDEKLLEGYYSKKLMYNVSLIRPELFMPFEWNIYWFNKVVSRYLSNYDLVINHNNTSFGIETGTKILSYVHFPRKARLLSGKVSIHKPEAGEVSVINLKNDFLNLLRQWYKRDNKILSNDNLVSNSLFTKKHILKSYPKLNERDVDVLYPPVNIKERVETSRKSRQVVSLARFTPAKRQLEQIRIAEQMPELNFKLMGFVADKDYFQECQTLISNKELRNIELIANASDHVRKTTLEESWYFIHSMQNEPFGISSVQAIMAGCIPVVHDSGGQQEIVNASDLRYTSVEEAVSILKNLQCDSDLELKKRSGMLFNRVLEFDTAIFCQRFQEMILSLLT